MRLRRWDVIFVPIDDSDSVGHPAVVLSHEDILDDPKLKRINVLIGTKRIPAVPPAAHDVVLNGADGLDFQTVVNCAFIYAVRKSSLLRQVGTVSNYRRQEIQKKVRSFLGLG